MSANEIHVGDIGTVFELTIMDGPSVVDISLATLANCIILKAPDDGKLTKTGVFVTDGTDGKVKYTTVANDLDEAGSWSIQAKIVLGTLQWYSSIENFNVHSNL